MKDFVDWPVRLRIASTPAHLPIVRAAVERLADALGFNETTRDQIALAVDEALANIIKHAYEGEPGRPIEISLHCVGASPEAVALRDWGRQADVAQIKPRPLDEVRPGGLGVHIMNSIMDEVEYVPAPDGGTRLIMVKAL